MSAPIDAVAFGVIIDDIVYPDGSTVMGVLGGGGPQTAFGMRLWQERVGLAAGVGEDFSRQVTASNRSGCPAAKVSAVAI